MAPRVPAPKMRPEDISTKTDGASRRRKGSHSGVGNSPEPRQPSSKKLKIFHYFGGTGAGAVAEGSEQLAGSRPSASASAVQSPRGGTNVLGGGIKAAGTSSPESGAPETGGGSWTGPGHDGSAGRNSDTLASAASPVPLVPSWGKMIDPRKKHRWDMLQRLREEDRGRADRGRPAPLDQTTAWARRSYSLGYVPAFQDARTPGMGSTSGAWGWASQSHVFGGARACVERRLPAIGVAAADLPARGRADAQASPGDSNQSDSAHPQKVDPSRDPRRVDRDLQARNFKVMCSWLSSSRLCTPGSAGHVGSWGTPLIGDESSRVSVEPSCPSQSLLQVALSGADGGHASALATLLSLEPEAVSKHEYGDSSDGNPISLALRLYHSASTWRRLPRRAPSRRPTSNRRPRPRPRADEPDLVDALDDDRARVAISRVEADFASGQKLVETGLAVSLREVAGRVGDETDTLAALAPREALTAAEMRGLAKGLGVSATKPASLSTGISHRMPHGTRDKAGKLNGEDAADAIRLGRRDERRADGKDELCAAIERWFMRPLDAAKRRARIARAAQKTVDFWASQSSAHDGARDDGGSRGVVDVLVVRLCDEAREAIHRVHVAFFAAARHGPLDAPAVLREDLALVSFGAGVAGADETVASHGRRRGSGFSDGSDGREPFVCDGEHGAARMVYGEKEYPGTTGVANGIKLLPPSPPPDVLHSVEIFEQFYKLVILADAVDIGAGAGDPGLAYASLHEASTVLFPSGCCLCRQHCQRLQSQAKASWDASGSPGFTPWTCDICELSATVVMRGVSLMERDRDYDNAFHYLEILLQARSQRLSVRRPQYWARLVTDLGHRKRNLEALRSCEKALEEAGVRESHTTCTVSGGRNPAVFSEAATVFPLGEALPLLRRAAKLAVPPLRWRKRIPPELREARLRVLRMDLSWRRSADLGESPVHKSARLDDTGDEEAAGAEAAEGTEDSVASTVVARGTSLEDAVLRVLLDELGTEWKGLHAENSICLGLFALLCWDAIFAAEVPVIADPSQCSRPSLPSEMRETTMGVRDAQSVETVEADGHIIREDRTHPSAEPFDADGNTNYVGDAEHEGEGKGDEMQLRFSSCCPEVDDGAAKPSRRPCVSPAKACYAPFPSPFQSEPLDLRTTAFAGRRQGILEDVYGCIERGKAAALVRRNWGRHYGRACTGLQWDLFPDGVEGWVNVACAIGPLPLSTICRNLASNYWAWRHGLPDLFLWRKDAAVRPAACAVPRGAEKNAEAAGATDERCELPTEGRTADEEGGGSTSVRAATSSPRVTGRGVKTRAGAPGVAEDGDGSQARRGMLRSKWVEVKGPGDNLSCAQEAWIDALVGAGAEAILLRVEDTSVTR